MPTKTTKKVATKKVAKKKAPAKKAVKPIVAPKPVMKDIPMPDPYCHCTKRKRNMILTTVSITCFLLGFFTYHIFFCPKHPHFKQHLQFENGCVVASSIQCPKLLQDLPMIDADHDGCVTKAELRAAKKPTRHHRRPAPVEEPTVNVEDAIAPVME